MPEAPDGKKFSPRPVIVISSAVALSLLGDSMLYAVLPSQAAVWGVPVALVGVLLSVNRFVRLVSNVWAGQIYRRFGRPQPFLGAMLLATLTTAAYAVVRGFGPFFVARVGWGICWSLLRLGCYTVVLETATPSQRGRMMGLYQSISRLGSLVGMLAGGFLTDLLGPRPTLLIFSGLTAVGVGIAWPEARAKGGSRVNAAPATPQATHARRPAPRSASPSPADAYRLQAVCYGTFANAFVVPGLVTSTLGLLLLRLFGPTVRVGTWPVGVASMTGLLLSVRFLGDLCLAAYFGHLSDRFGRAKVTAAALLVGMGALLGLAFARHLPLVALAAIAVFLSGTALTVTLDATAGDLAPAERRAEIMSRYATWLDLGSATGPLLAYAIGISLGLSTMYMGGVFVLLSAGAFYLFAFSRGQSRYNSC